LSLLLANGHPDARRYPLGMLMDEVGLVHQRMDEESARLLEHTHLAVSAVIDKDAAKTLNEKIKELTNGQARR